MTCKHSVLGVQRDKFDEEYLQCESCFVLLDSWSWNQLGEKSPAASMCNDYRPDDIDCNGAVMFRMSLSPSGENFPRCESHWGKRLKEQDQINQRYPELPPADFDPLFAGETW